MRTAVGWRPPERFRQLFTRQTSVVIWGVFVTAAILIGVALGVLFRRRTKGFTDGQALLSDPEYQDAAWRYPRMGEPMDTYGIPLVQESGALFQLV
jgi:hypothetical protein